jgi:flagellar hook-associated protein 2
MGTFSVDGIISGLDTSSIISQLMDIERRPLRLLQQREERANTKLSLFQQLNSLVSSLKTATETIGAASTLQSASAASSDTAILTATGGASQNLGVFTIQNITAVARQNVLRSDNTFASPTTALGATAGQFEIFVGGSSAATVTYSATDTLNDIRDKINSANVGALASVVDFTGSGSYRLIVTATKEGTTNAVSLPLAQDTGNLIGTVLNVSEQQTAADASFTFAGTTVTRASNTITDLISGVTIQLRSTHTGGVGSTNITVTADTATNQSNIQTWVDSVNSLMSFLKEQLTFDSKASQQKPLYGDSTANAIRQDVRSKLTAQLSGLGSSTVTALSRLGITFSVQTGLLEVDTTRLDEQLKARPAEVSAFFTALKGELTSVAGDKLLDQLTKTVSGTITTRIDGLNDEIESLQQAQERTQQRLTLKEQMLRAQFTRLEQALQEMQSQSTFFLNQLGLQQQFQRRR